MGELEKIQEYTVEDWLHDMAEFAGVGCWDGDDWVWLTEDEDEET